VLAPGGMRLRPKRIRQLRGGFTGINDLHERATDGGGHRTGKETEEFLGPCFVPKRNRLVSARPWTD